MYPFTAGLIDTFPVTAGHSHHSTRDFFRPNRVSLATRPRASLILAISAIIGWPVGCSGVKSIQSSLSNSHEREREREREREERERERERERETMKEILKVLGLDDIKNLKQNTYPYPYPTECTETIALP